MGRSFGHTLAILSRIVQNRSMDKCITIYEATSIVNAISHAAQWAKAADGGCWFRGVKNNSLKLLPGAYWRANYSEVAPLLQFSQEAGVFSEVGQMDDWKTYYLAQHHGVPTRLLDWTENILTALFFAVDGWDATTTPCVWMIRPSAINYVACKWKGIISPENNPELNAWLPSAIKKGPKKVSTADGGYVYDSKFPVALYARRNNLRIIAQQGAFTLHGSDPRPLDQLCLEEFSDNHSDVIARLDFHDIDVEEARNDLYNLGLRRSTIYPDLHNFVLQMKEEHGWQ